MTRPRIARNLERLVRERAQGYCEYCLCRESYATERFSLEHIIPFVAGGRSAESNLALACQGCNGAKYTGIRALDDVTGKMAALYHPRKDEWHEHFTWDAGYTLLIGLTPTGRVTIKELDLNRAGVINLRRAMSLEGQHPPTDRSSSK